MVETMAEAFEFTFRQQEKLQVWAVVYWHM